MPDPAYYEPLESLSFNYRKGKAVQAGNFRGGVKCRILAVDFSK